MPDFRSLTLAMRILVRVLPAAVLLVIWLPLARQYHASTPAISDAVLASSRRAPDEAVLQEARGFALFPVERRDSALEVRIAERLLGGRLEIPTVPRADVHLPFDERDLVTLPSGASLWYAGFAVPDFLLAAYVDTGREEFFTAATAFIVRWGEFERRRILPVGLLRNDHATAARVRVLGEFWRLYRGRADFDAELGRAVLQQAARAGNVLRAPGQFTFATNHGMIQNIGLLHLSLAFPALPGSAADGELAVARLREQLPFLLDDEGIFREHSPGYQAFDLELLGTAFRCMTLLGTPIPEAWAAKYRLAVGVFGRLRRPDGTLPIIGDTDGGSPHDLPRVTDIDADGRSAPLRIPEVWRPDTAWALHPSAGYVVRWSGLDRWPERAALRQAVLSWSSPPPPAHKHADELGAVLWSGGVLWLTGVGYWPYGGRGREQAEGWASSNAPHSAREPASSVRQSRVLGAGRGASASVVDVERRGPAGYVARRQLVDLAPDAWIILDELQGDDGSRHESIWTTAAGIEATPAPGGSVFVLRAPAGAVARLEFLGSPGLRVTAHRGSLEPFAGWQVRDYQPERSVAFVAEQAARDAWQAVVLEVGDATGSSAAARSVVEWRSPQEWSITLSRSGRTGTVSRRGALVEIGGEGLAPDTVSVESVPPPAAELATIRAAFVSIASRYPRFDDQLSRRAKLSASVVLGMLLQEPVFLLLRRRRTSAAPRFAALGALGWLAVLAVVHLVLLRNWYVVQP